jgi:hypothetical protein
MRRQAKHPGSQQNRSGSRSFITRRAHAISPAGSADQRCHRARTRGVARSGHGRINLGFRNRGS